MSRKPIKIIISGGGTGGHIYPAVSIANALKAADSTVDILFVGALGRMEMEKVPAAGYPIEGLPIAGLQREKSLHALLANLSLPIKIAQSVAHAGRIIDRFGPQVAVGVGGYASGPLLWSARRKGIPYLLQEQNSFAGKTNKMLAKEAFAICVAYKGMEQFFPAEKIILTGNPIREGLSPASAAMKAEAQAHFGLDPAKRTLLVVGGSLGARTLNRCMAAYLPRAAQENVQIIWQCGKQGLAGATEAMQSYPTIPVQLHAFLSRMDLAFAASDAVISRAGAGTISELCVAGKPCLFVPSPNVAEDHQTHNALALVNEEAAWMVRDAEASEKLMDTALTLVRDTAACERLSTRIQTLGMPHAAATIAQLILDRV